MPHDPHMAVHTLEDQPEDTGHLVVHGRGGPAWLLEHLTVLRSWASTVTGAEVGFHHHPTIPPNDTLALSVDQLTSSHPDVNWHSAALNPGWLSPTGYDLIPEACGHTSSDTSGGRPCRHALSVVLAADVPRTWVVAISCTVPDGEGVATSIHLQYGTRRPWVHTVEAEVILHFLRHADRKRATEVSSSAWKVVNGMPLQWIQHSPLVRGHHTEHPFLFARATSHHSDALLPKADWAVSQGTVLQNTPLGPRRDQLLIAGSDSHLDMRPPTMQTLGAAAQRAQDNHASTHRGHKPLGAAHATAYVHTRDLTAAAANHRALRARDGHTPVQRRLLIRKEQLFGVAIFSQACLLCGGQEETPVHMHVGCAHSRLLWPHYLQAVHEAAQHTSRLGTRRYGWPSGVPPEPSGRRSSVTGWCSKRQRRSSAGLPATTRWGDVCGRVPPAHALAGAFCVRALLPPAGATSRRPTVRRPGRTDGSLRPKAAAPPLPHVAAEISSPPSAS